MPILRVVTAIAAVLVIAGVLWDAFETVVLPRQVSQRFRLTRAYVRVSWRAWSALARRAPAIERREAALAVFGPLALLVLLALWVSLLIVAFALLLWGLGSPLAVTGGAAAGIGTNLYFSGTTFLTLGLGDVVPHAGTRASCRGRGGRHWLRRARASHRLPAGALPGHLAPRDAHLAPRCARRVAAQRGRPVPPPPARPPRAAAHRHPGRLGGLVGGAAGDPPPASCCSPPTARSTRTSRGWRPWR